MQKRLIGRSGISIAPLVLGGNVFGWTADEAASFGLLDRFLDQGFDAIDTADVYSAFVSGNSGGESETIIGNWLNRRRRRDDVILMTKVGMWDQRKGLSSANIEAAAEDSLRRLRTDYIDVYFAHIDDANIPLEESLAAFSRLIRRAKYGRSGHRIIPASGSHRLSISQPRNSCRGMRSCSRNTICTIARNSRAGSQTSPP